MAAPVNSGSDYEIRNITVTTSDTPIDFSASTGVSSVIVRCRSSVDLYLRKNRNDADYFTIPSGTSMSFDVGYGRTIPFYLRSATGSVVVEAMASF